MPGVDTDPSHLVLTEAFSGEPLTNPMGSELSDLPPFVKKFRKAEVAESRSQDDHF